VRELGGSGLSHPSLLRRTLLGLGLLPFGLFGISALAVAQEPPSGGSIDPAPFSLQLDVHASGGTSNLNGVFEPGETVVVEPAWIDRGLTGYDLSGIASQFAGPPGGTYSLLDSTATYLLLVFGGGSSCFDFAGNCYVISVDAPSQRPAEHWDASFHEAVTGPGVIGGTIWTLHIGESFPDVPTSHLYYAFVENIFHNGVTGGCGGGNYCPSNPVTRAQMAVFLLKAKYGSSYAPPVCTGTVFLDVPCSGGVFDPWIEDLAGHGITGGCGNGNYCPADSATRRQMAVFLLKSSQGAGYVPPSAVGIFEDVPQDDTFAPWIEDLYNRGITGGCQAAPLLYCPGNPNMRGQMAVVLVKTFGLLLYGP